MAEQEKTEPQVQVVETQDATPRFTPQQEAVIRQALQRESALKQREAELQRREAELQQRAAQSAAPKPAPKPQDALQQQLMQMQQELQSLRKREEAQTQEKQRVAAAQQLAETIAKDESFPVLRSGVDLNLHQMVLDEMEDHYATTGQELSPEKAMSNVEAWLAGLVEKGAAALGYVKADANSSTLTNQLSSQRTNLKGVDPMDFALHPEKYFKK